MIEYLIAAGFIGLIVWSRMPDAKIEIENEQPVYRQITFHLLPDDCKQTTLN